MADTLEQLSLSNAIDEHKSLTILILYFIIIGSLCFRCISIILAHAVPAGNTNPRNHYPVYSIFLFACLAVASLASTWSYMISFLTRSYQDWLVEHPDAAAAAAANPLFRLRGWLDETYLFEQAWAAIIETEARFWWTIQISGFASIWSVFLGIEGTRHRIASIWIFMVLSQLVAISFATNLSFVLVLLARWRSSSSHAVPTRFGFGPHLVAITSSACAALTRAVHGDNRFMIVLLMPHVLAFAPMAPWLKPSKSVYYTVIFLAGITLAHTTFQAMSSGWTVSDIVHALYEYPAVSSAGWDVIMCWVSFTAWVLVN